MGTNWIVRATGHACLPVLEQTRWPDVPLFWEKHTDWRETGTVNDYLVNLFENLLEQVNVPAALPPAENLKQGVDRDILALLDAA